MVQVRTKLKVEPLRALSDTPLTVAAEGLPANGQVTITARLAESDGDGEWTAYAVFEADESGAVDLSSQAPIKGSYTVADPNGLIWSLAPETTSNKRRSIQSGLESYRLEISIEHDGEVLDTQSVERLAIDPAVSIEQLREDIKANVFLPPGDGPFPTVLVLAGSGGGFSDIPAALLASRGYATVSLAYFGVEGLPDELLNIPLEYFESALTWITEQPQFDTSRLVVLGTSRGGELALLLGSRYPLLKGVIAYVPSGYLWGAVSADNSEDAGADYPSWTYQGNPLPYVERVRNVDVQPEGDGSLNLTPAFLRFIEDESRAEPATIPVESINGPVLLLSGDDDALWPSAQFSQLIERRLRERGFDFAVESHVYEGAGHSIGQPFSPTTTNSGLHPVRGVVINLGGSPEANARAREDSWKRVLTFLDQHFGDPITGRGQS